MTVIILLGYDTEGGGAVSEYFLQKASEIHVAHVAPATFFVVGERVIDNPISFPELLRVRANPLFEIASHTYKHETFLNRDRTVSHAPEVIEASLARTTTALREKLHIDEPTGLTTPVGYFRGLQERPAQLAVVRKAGIRYVRSFLRWEEPDMFPVPPTCQPFWYDKDGFPDILEMPITGWQDNYWYRAHGWDQDFSVELITELDAYIEADKVLPDLERQYKPLVMSLCLHDKFEIEASEDLANIDKFLQKARQRPVVFMTYMQYYLLECQHRVARRLLHIPDRAPVE